MIELEKLTDEQLTNLLTQTAPQGDVLSLADLAHDSANGPAPFSLGVDENGEIVFRQDDDGVYCPFDEADLFQDADGDHEDFLAMRKQMVSDWLATGVAARDFREWLEQKNIRAIA